MGVIVWQIVEILRPDHSPVYQLTERSNGVNL